MSSTHISFITTIKICKGYEWLINSFVFYVKNIQHYCEKHNISYEILVCEQVNEKNMCKIKDVCDFGSANIQIYELKQEYPNPFDFNLIESYGKNLCLKHAHGIYTCMTSADILFSEDFFVYIKHNIEKEVFYRFATYEIPRYDIDISTNITDILNYCFQFENENENKRLANGGCFTPNVSIFGLAQKSGDVMLLDTASFQKIKGWPETICFTHMDFATCIVATNNYRFIVPDKSICVYTFKQQDRLSDMNTVKYVQLQNGQQCSLEDFQMHFALSYMQKKVSN